MNTQIDMSIVKEGKTEPIVATSRTKTAIEQAETNGLLAREIPGDNSSPFAQESQDYYLELSAYYRKAFEVYALKTLRLDLFDKELKDSGLGFVSTPDKRRAIQQDSTSLALDCMYIYSNGYNIEYLSKDDVETLKHLYEENIDVITEEALDLVERTFMEVIIKYDSLNNAPYPSNQTSIGFYDSTSGVGYDFNALIIMIPNVEIFDEDGGRVPDETELVKKRNEYLFERLPQLYEEYTEKLGMRVNFVITSGAHFVEEGVYDRETNTIVADVPKEYAWYTIGFWGINPDPYRKPLVSSKWARSNHSLGNTNLTEHINTLLTTAAENFAAVDSAMSIEEIQSF